MRIFKYLLMLAVLLSAAFQIVYGCILFANPSFIGNALQLGDVSSNVAPLSVTQIVRQTVHHIGSDVWSYRLLDT